MSAERERLNIEANRLALALIGAGVGGSTADMAAVMEDITPEHIVYVLAALATLVVRAVEVSPDDGVHDFLVRRVKETDEAEARLRE